MITNIQIPSKIKTSPKINSITNKDKKKNKIEQQRIRGLKFEQYKECLLEGKIKRHDFATIRSTKHKLSTIRQRKKALSHFDCKRFLFACGIHSLPYGHYKIKKHFYGTRLSTARIK